jgi:hypothetical protein
VHNLNTLITQLGGRHGALDLVLITHEVKTLDLAIGAKRELGTFDDDSTSVVATHDIHGYTHKRAME